LSVKWKGREMLIDRSLCAILFKFVISELMPPEYKNITNSYPGRKLILEIK